MFSSSVTVDPSLVTSLDFFAVQNDHGRNFSQSLFLDDENVGEAEGDGKTPKAADAKTPKAADAKTPKAADDKTPKAESKTPKSAEASGDFVISQIPMDEAEVPLQDEDESPSRRGGLVHPLACGLKQQFKQNPCGFRLKGANVCQTLIQPPSKGYEGRFGGFRLKESDLELPIVDATSFGVPLENILNHSRLIPWMDRWRISSIHSRLLCNLSFRLAVWMWI